MTNIYNILEKYTPVSENDFKGNQKTIQSAISILESHGKLIVSGSKGCGKSSLVNYLVKKFEFKVVNLDRYEIKSYAELKEKLNVFKFSTHQKTCVVFEDIEYLLNDNILKTDTISIIDSIHNVHFVFTVNDRYISKVEKHFGSKQFICNMVSLKKNQMHSILLNISNNENLKISSNELKECCVHLPDIRQCIYSLYIAQDVKYDSSDITYNLCEYFNRKKTIRYLSSHYLIYSMLHEILYTSFKKIHYLNFLDLLCIGDVTQTICYTTQRWDTLDIQLHGFLLHTTIAKKTKMYKVTDFPFPKIVCKMSNKHTKRNTYGKLKVALDCTTVHQLYLCKLNQSKNCKLNRNMKTLLSTQFM